MHDSEPDTFEPMTWPQLVCSMLAEIGVSGRPNEIASADVENDEYYSRYFTQAPRMVTNKGSLEVSGHNIDAIQIVQKG